MIALHRILVMAFSWLMLSNQCGFSQTANNLPKMTEAKQNEIIGHFVPLLEETLGIEISKKSKPETQVFNHEAEGALFIKTEHYPILVVKQGLTNGRTFIEWVVDGEGILRQVDMISAQPPFNGKKEQNRALVVEKIKNNFLNGYKSLKERPSKTGHSFAFNKMSGDTEILDEFFGGIFDEFGRVNRIVNKIESPYTEAVLSPKLTVNEALIKAQTAAENFRKSRTWKSLTGDENPGNYKAGIPKCSGYKHIHPNTLFNPDVLADKAMETEQTSKRWAYPCKINFDYIGNPNESYSEI